jgi:CubicO group peptidase (beta-lactamase class C family)
VIAGVIIEKVSRLPLLKFLQEKVFAPLGMTSVADIDQERLGDTDPIGYTAICAGTTAHGARRKGRAGCSLR